MRQPGELRVVSRDPSPEHKSIGCARWRRVSTIAHDTHHVSSSVRSVAGTWRPMHDAIHASLPELVQWLPWAIGYDRSVCATVRSRVGFCLERRPCIRLRDSPPRGAGSSRRQRVRVADLRAESDRGDRLLGQNGSHRGRYRDRGDRTRDADRIRGTRVPQDHPAHRRRQRTVGSGSPNASASTTTACSATK